MSDFRKRLEKASAPYLARVHALPRWVLPVFMTTILLIGLLANPNQSPGLWIGFFCLTFYWPLFNLVTGTELAFID